ncbi:uncharacterized protein LOC142339929 [Convolutriloba macropyga]|uniref:uncharacterized protein LOC142339929 n=1 Tax=Convolutriloba macropyga TaxID=536237 RepID=UPI003F5229A8
MSSYSSERHEEQRFSSSSGAVLVGASAGVGAYVLPEATMVGTSTDVVPGAAFYRHQSAYKTEKADGLGRTSRVEATRFEKRDAACKQLETTHKELTTPGI